MGATPGLFLRPGFLPADLAARVSVHVCSSPGDPAAVEPEPGAGMRVADEVRRAWEVELPATLHDDLVARIERVRPALASFFDTALEPCDAVAALRYPPGAFYLTHRDTSPHADPGGLHRRAVSVVVFANSGRPHPDAAFAGGALRLHEVDGAPGGIREIAAMAGTLAAFRSGQLHEVTRVRAGTRVTIVTWLLRSGRPARRGRRG